MPPPLNAQQRCLKMLLIVVATLCLLSKPVYADAGLIVETPTGLLGFLSNVGHVSVWISHGCLDATGQILYCEDSEGLVFTSTAYWPNPGAAAIPANLFFLGSHPGSEGRSVVAWEAKMANIYPDVNPATGAKYMGRAWLRSLRVLKFATSPDEDRRVLAEINSSQHTYRYSYSHRNCAFYAQTILQMYFGGGFHANRTLELGIDTPRALERALEHRLSKDAVPNEMIAFRGRLRHAWRQPPRNICESALFDPKYAIPLLIYQPYLYAGFAGCYVAIRITSSAKRHRPDSGLRFAQASAAAHRSQQIEAFTSLTGFTGVLFASDNNKTNISATLDVQTPVSFPDGHQ